MKIHNVLQQTPDWDILRIDFPFTASNAQAIGNQGKGLETLIYKKLSEKYSTAETENYTNADLDRGNELEPLARSMYELETGLIVTQVGFVTNKKYELSGASPDGLVDKGLIEIKCLNDVKHFSNVIELKIESKYYWQMQMQMLITNRKWCDYVLFNPNFEKSLLIKRVKPDKDKQEKIIEGIIKGVKMYKELEIKFNK